MIDIFNTKLTEVDAIDSARCPDVLLVKTKITKNDGKLKITTRTYKCNKLIGHCGSHSKIKKNLEIVKSW